MTVEKTIVNNALIIIAIIFNLFFIGNMFFSGWSLFWPTVPGQVVDTEIKEYMVADRRRNYCRYSLVLRYTYQFGLTEHKDEVPVDNFSTKQLANMAADKYRQSPIKVHVNPFYPSISTIKSGDNFINSLIASILFALLTALLFFMKPGRTVK